MEGTRERRLSVDRFEGDLVVVRDDGGRSLDLPRWLFPGGVREGDVVVFRRTEVDGTARLEARADRGAGDAARAEAEAILARLRRSDADSGLTG